MLRLKEIDRHNFADIIGLSVGPEQQRFTVTPAFSLAQAGVQPECLPLAVYAGNEPVGFLMYGLDPDDRAYWIYRLMIDLRYQAEGYGRETLQLLLNRIQADPEHHAVFISTHPENIKAQALYESMGFYRDGRIIYGNIVYKLEY